MDLTHTLRVAGDRALPLDHVSEACQEAPKFLAAESVLVAVHDVGHDRVGGAHLAATSLGGHNQLGPPIGGVWPALDVTQTLEVVDDHADDLLDLPGQPRQIGGANALGS